MRPLPIRTWTEATDDEIVRGIRAGDEPAFAELHRRYRAPLERYAGRLLGHDHRSLDDVLQDVFHRAHTALRSARTRPLALRPWLYKVTYNRCVDELRSNRQSDQAAEIDEGMAGTGASVWAEVAARLAVREALGDIAALPQRQRTALLAVALEGRTHEQLAAELGTSVGASKSLVNRARGGLLELRAARAVAEDGARRPAEPLAA